MGALLRLLRTELTRLRWRRAVLLLVAASFVIPAFVFAGTVWNSRPYSDQEIADARASATSQPGFEREVQRCEKHPRRYGAEVAADCEELMISNWSSLYREPLRVRNELRGNMPGVITTVAILLMLSGATFVGADWASGSMSNQLLFEPRRIRVWLAKAAAVGLAATLLAVIVQTLYWAGIYLVSDLRDLTPPAALKDDVMWMTARGTFVIALAAVAGFAMTMLFRSTVFTLGLLFVVAVAGTFIVAVLPLGGQNDRYMIPTNVAAVIQGKVTYWVDPPADCWDNMTGRPNRQEGESRAEFDERCSSERTLTVWDGLRFLSVPTVLGLGLSLLSFRRRDVP